MTNEIMTANSINALANKEIKSNLKKMLQALETGKKATWQYAIALSKIMGEEQYKEDFHDLKTFAEYVNTSKATLSQYNNAVAFMTRENLIPMKEQKNGKSVIDYANINLTVANAYLLSVLSEEEFKQFKKYCEDNAIVVFALSQNKLKDAIKAWKETLTEDEEQESKEDEEQESKEDEEQERTENRAVRIAVDTKEKALVAIATLMKQFNITLEEIVEQEI